MFEAYSPIEPQDWSQPIGFCQVPALDLWSDSYSMNSQDTSLGSYSSPSVFSLSGSSETTMDSSTLSQIPDEIPFSLDTVVSSQDLQPLDPVAWSFSIQGCVETGYSPTQSNMCQSSALKFAMAQPESSMCQLPSPYLTWEPEVNEAFAGPHHEVSPQVIPESGNHYGPGYLGFAEDAYFDIEAIQGSTPTYCSSGGHVEYPSVISPRSMRPLLPRTDAIDVARQPTFGSQRVLRPQTQGDHRPIVFSSVSNIAGDPKRTTIEAISPVVAAVPSLHATRIRAASTVASNPVPVDGAFTDFIDFQLGEQAAYERVLHDAHQRHIDRRSPAQEGYHMLNAEQTRCFSATEISGTKTEADPNDSARRSLERLPKAISNAPGSLTGDNDEGRYRTHHLYSRPPGPDGMYRCPYKEKEPSCPHKATKLKCNYDKYVDSHLKPFRCKVEACFKQEFSSTACLLRHEREAHGMHGHGDRPHLCYYAGCERSAQGHGFPRRYNLFDHMKRVHDHREDAVDASGTPILGGETQKKIKGAKRKASTSPVTGQPAQKTMTIHQPVPLVVPVLQNGYYGPQYYCQ